jgi:hypothetical protein
MAILRHKPCCSAIRLRVFVGVIIGIIVRIVVSFAVSNTAPIRHGNGNDINIYIENIKPNME